MHFLEAYLTAEQIEEIATDYVEALDRWRFVSDELIDFEWGIYTTHNKAGLTFEELTAEYNELGEFLDQARFVTKTKVFSRMNFKED